MIALILAGHLALGQKIEKHELDDRARRTEAAEANDVERAEKAGHSKLDPVRALNAPDAVSAEIPIDRDLVLPFERRPATPRDAEAHRRIVNALWKTTLGQTLLAYLFDQFDPIELPSRARQFMRWIFADGAQVPTRLGAIQFMTEDLYARGRLSQDAFRRLVLLQSDLYQQSQNASLHMKKRLMVLLLIFFVLSLPFGSPIVREEASKLWERPVAFFRRVVRHAKNPSQLDRLTPLRIFSRAVFNGYEITPAVNAFFASFGPASMLFFLYVEWSAGLTGNLFHDVKMLEGLDSLMRAAEF